MYEVNYLITLFLKKHIYWHYAPPCIMLIKNIGEEFDMVEKDTNPFKEKNKLRFILRKLIIDTRIKEAELSRILGISKSTLHQLLNTDNISPQIDTLRPIAKYFNITIDQLIGDSPLNNLSTPQGTLEEDTDLRPWNPDLYRQCVDEICVILKAHQKIVPAIKTLSLIKEVYFYSLGKGDIKVDKAFAQWLSESKF